MSNEITLSLDILYFHAPSFCFSNISAGNFIPEYARFSKLCTYFNLRFPAEIFK